MNVGGSAASVGAFKVGPSALVTEIRGSNAANQEGLEFDIRRYGSVLYLDDLRVDPGRRFTGVASRFLVELCQQADRFGLDVELEVGPSEEDGVTDLPAFYQKFGFCWINGFMRRKPHCGGLAGEVLQ